MMKLSNTSNKKKILIISNYCWTIYNFRLALINDLLGQGFEVYLIAKKDKYSKQLAKIGCKLKTIDIDLNGKNVLLDFITITKFYVNIKNINPDLCILYTIKPNIYGSTVCAILNIKYINCITGLGTVFINEGITKYFASFLYKIALKKSSQVIFQNRDDMNLFIKKSLTSKDKSKLIKGSGIDISRFRSNKKTSSEDFIFLYVGRLLKEKGINEYIESAIQINNIYKNIKFWIIGEYNKNNPSTIQKDTLKKFKSVKQFKYFHHTDRIEDYISKANCIVLPSYREGLSRSLLEAMSMSKMVIASDVPGCRDLIKTNKNGYLFKPNNVESLKNCLLKVINLKAKEVLDMGKVSRSIVELNYSDKIINKKYIKLVNNLLF
jgi:glycosyltransferase involved in cell wall biosynthesis